MLLESDYSFDNHQKDENELWSLFLEGCQKSLGGLFLRYHTRLFRYGIGIIQNEDAVKDGIQELFLKLWKNRRTIETATSIEIYLLVSLRRILIKQKKQRETHRFREQKYMQIMPHMLQSDEDAIIQKEHENERIEHFNRALKTLTNRQKEVIYLRLQHGLTNEEISLTLNISHQRVKNCIYEAVKKMKEHIYSWPVKDINFE